jgi:Tol biopolymer transport system component
MTWMRMRTRGVRSLFLGALAAAAACEDGAGPGEVADVEYDLLYEAVTSGIPELFVLPMEGGAPVRVRAPGAGWAADPVTSPDGTRIAFVVWDVDGETSDIYVINRDGSGLARLTDAPEEDDQPAWSPDGARIAFRSFRTGRAGDIWVMNADGSQPRALTVDPLPGVTDERRPAWSPDGSRIAYAGNEGGDMDLWSMRSDGTDPVRLTSSPDFDTEPAWSPDGTRIAFRRSSPEMGSDLMLVPAAGGEPARLALPRHQLQPAWSPDGRMIAYAETESPTGTPALFTIRPDGTGIQPRTTGGQHPAFIRRAD